MASGVITLPDEFIPKLVEQLSEYGEKAFVMTKNIRLSLSRKRKLSVYIDAWPEFTTVLVKITVRSRDIVNIEYGLEKGNR
ncbi:hypothetical protein LSH36_405g02026 [Paralvinella palmiformis]|uniref:Uncharacterized protein n=1 Tax=Paralvinella palmiformis TaxID=53620 RepID=A0AAD9N008_9ANNE|nr:hypothetical protein LSH36_405g02026 [Paralvinella palmiformis]